MILKLGKRFLCFFDMSLQKNVKSRFFGFKKNEKTYSRTMTPITPGTGKATWTSNLAGTFTYVPSEQKPIKILEKRERGRIQGLPKFLGTPYYLRNR